MVCLVVVVAMMVVSEYEMAEENTAAEYCNRSDVGNISKVDCRRG